MSNNLMSRADLIDLLNGLIKVCHEAQEGYTWAAATATDSPTLEGLFTTYASQRRRFITDLSKIVQSLGGESVKYDEGNSGFNASTSTHAALYRCEHREALAEAVYGSTLEKAIPKEIFEVIFPQYQSVTQAHHQMQQLLHKYFQQKAVSALSPQETRMK